MSGRNGMAKRDPSAGGILSASSGLAGPGAWNLAMMELQLLWSCASLPGSVFHVDRGPFRAR
jgi:hypothetical protein